ncbi:lipid kinase [Novispirillum sp. DQ9]|uniref:lipid kinase n=1 Tax=Novispirillum sp. DQ9 TaxID=3398612 RepID=UPI003C7D25C4
MGRQGEAAHRHGAAASTTATTTLLVVNPHSARGGAEIGAAIAVLEARGHRVLFHAGDSPGALPALVERHAREADRVVVGGGDGTLNGVLEAVLHAGLPLGILPLGTANDLARGLGIPADPVAACRIIADGHARPIDIGCVNGKHFFNVASLGASVEIARAMHRRRDRNTRWGVLSYPLAMMEAVKFCRPFRAHLRVDGHEQDVTSYQISVGNGRFYGGGMLVAEEAALDDGSLDLYSLKVRSAWQVLLHLPALRAGRHHTWRGVLHLRGRDITVRTNRPMPINTDGELTTHTPARFTVLPGALTVYVPLEGGDALRRTDKESSTVSLFRSDAEVALDDVVVACKKAAEHLAEAAALTRDDARPLSDLFAAQSDERAAMAAELERHMVGMGAYPGDPDDDLEVMEEAVLRVRDVLSADHRRLLVEDNLAETEDLATAISRALQEDIPEDTHAALGRMQKVVARAIATLRAARADLAAEDGDGDGEEA